MKDDTEVKHNIGKTSPFFRPQKYERRDPYGFIPFADDEYERLKTAGFNAMIISACLGAVVLFIWTVVP